MDVEDAAAKWFEQRWPDEAHIASQNDPLDVMSAQLAHDLALERGFVRIDVRIEGEDWNAGLLSERHRAARRPIGDDERQPRHVPGARVSSMKRSRFEPWPEAKTANAVMIVFRVRSRQLPSR